MTFLLVLAILHIIHCVHNTAYHGMFAPPLFLRPNNVWAALCLQFVHTDIYVFVSSGLADHHCLTVWADMCKPSAALEV